MTKTFIRLPRPCWSGRRCLANRSKNYWVSKLKPKLLLLALKLWQPQHPDLFMSPSSVQTAMYCSYSAGSRLVARYRACSTFSTVARRGRSHDAMFKQQTVTIYSRCIQTLLQRPRYPCLFDKYTVLHRTVGVHLRYVLVIVLCCLVKVTHVCIDVSYGAICISITNIVLHLAG